MRLSQLKKMDNYQPHDYKFYERYKVAPPSVAKHGTEADIRDNMQQLKPYSWRMEGNKLIGKTDMGDLVNYLPTDVILTGTDEKGMPILEKIKMWYIWVIAQPTVGHYKCEVSKRKLNKGKNNGRR